MPGKKDKNADVAEEPKCDPRNYARYYDTPDGCDIMKKVMVASRYGFVAGLILGTYDVLMYSHVVGTGPILKRYARHAVPLGLMGATFAAVSNQVLRVRNVDDQLNYFLGGLACGPLLALYLRSGHGVVAGGIFLGLIGVVKKESIMQGHELFHKFPSHMNTITSCRNNSSLVADPRDEMIHTCDSYAKKQKDHEKIKCKEQQPAE